MDTAKTYHFVAFLGSLRAASYNAMALRAAQAVAPPNIRIEVLEIAGLPHYNADVEKTSPPPEFNTLSERVKAADGVLIVSPEYNYSVPGFLKNALDWISRHPSKPFQNKAVGIMGASPGMLGTGRMQYHLRQIMVFLEAYAVLRPEVMIAKAAEKFSPEGELTDDKTKELIGKLLVAIADLGDKLR
jgi:chromate reductase